MRIIFISNAGLLTGGSGKSMLELMEELKSHYRHHLFLVAPEGELLEVARGRGFICYALPLNTIKRSINPFILLRGAMGFLWIFKKLVQIIRKSEARILHANDLKSAIIGSLAGKLSGAKTVFHVRDFLAVGLFRKYLVQAAYQLCTVIIVNSKSVGQTFGRDPLGKVKVIYNGISPSPSLDAARKRELRIRYKISSSDILLGYVGRLHPEKCLEILVSAFKQIYSKESRTKLWIVGAALPDDESYETYLKKIVKDLGLEKAVTFWGWREDVLELMNLFDIFVLPSLREPFGRVTLEAMFLGLPIVATASGGTLEIITDGLTGRLVPPKDVAALDKVCEEFITDRNSGVQMGKRAQAVAYECFTKEQCTERVQQVYGLFNR